MNGTQPIHTRLTGNTTFLIKTGIIVLAILCTLSACSDYWFVGDARGDWTLDLFDGYAITKVNSYEILLIYKEHLNDPGGSIIIPNFYVSGYQLHKPYICLEGICTENMAASKEELNNKQMHYYLVNTGNDEVIGPFATFDELDKYGNSIQLEIASIWAKPMSADD